MSLTEPQVRTAKPAERAYKLYDTGGLYLRVTPSGSKLWRMRFVLAGKEKTLSIGRYPKVGIAQARKARDAAREQLDQGADPAEQKQERKRAARAKVAAGITFKRAAREWRDLRQHEWTENYSKQVWTRLEDDIFPKLGAKTLKSIKAPEMLATLKAVEARGVLETTRRLKQYCSAIFRYAIAAGYCDIDPAAPLKGALKAPPKPKHHKALPRDEVGELLIKLSNYDGEPETGMAISLALLMVPRTTELRASAWTEFENWRADHENALWRVPAERMKMDDPHLVPMSRQACEILRRLHKLTGHSQYLFPSNSREGVMSNNTMLFALYRMGFHGRTTTHGFRRIFSTEANEHGFNEDWIERQLAHDERNRVRAAYNAAQYLPQRRTMLQWWADYLDGLKDAESKKRAASANGALA